MHFDGILTLALVGTPRRGVLEVETASLPLWLATKSGWEAASSSSPPLPEDADGAASLPTQIA
jgi:hypothetical protein